MVVWGACPEGLERSLSMSKEKERFSQRSSSLCTPAKSKEVRASSEGAASVLNASMFNGRQRGYGFETGGKQACGVQALEESAVVWVIRHKDTRWRQRAHYRSTAATAAAFCNCVCSSVGVHFVGERSSTGVRRGSCAVLARPRSNWGRGCDVRRELGGG